MKIKKIGMVFLAVLIAFTIPLWGQSQSTGLQPTPVGLQNASQLVVMSRLNLQNGELPSRVDLSEGVLIARNQGRIGSCGPFAVSNTMTIMLRLRDNLQISNQTWFSPSFLYNQVMIGNDQGSTYYDNLELAKSAGIATAITFPYTEDTRLQPGVNAFREAQRYKISEWQRIQHDDINAFKMFLAKGYPIMVVIKTYDNIFNYQGGIYYPEGSPRGTFHGVTVTGYDDSTRLVTAMNSWGDTWGDGKGCFQFSYETLADSGSLVQSAYILVPAALDPSAPLFPAGVEASRGMDKLVLKWQAAVNALEYEVFRLDSMAPTDPREVQYISLGMTSSTTFEDSTAEPDHHYFYLVRTHTRNESSDLSFPVEGWSSTVPNIPPGIPSGFNVLQQNNTVVCRWDRVENADRYIVYSWRVSDWIKVGETTETFFIDVNPVKEGNSPISYMVVAENSFGKSLPSGTSSVLFRGNGLDNNNKPDEGRGERYNGNFYSFPINNFVQAEQRFLSNFQNHATQFRLRFAENQQRFIDYFGGRK